MGKKQKTITIPSAEKPNVRVVGTLPFKLKDRPQSRSFKFVHLKEVFGVVPETIAVCKVPGVNNKIIVRAFIPTEPIKIKTKKL